MSQSAGSSRVSKPGSNAPHPSAKLARVPTLLGTDDTQSSVDSIPSLLTASQPPGRVRVVQLKAQSQPKHSFQEILRQQAAQRRAQSSLDRDACSQAVSSAFRSPEPSGQLYRTPDRDRSLEPLSNSERGTNMDEGGIGSVRRDREQSGSGLRRSSPYRSPRVSSMMLPEDDVRHGGIVLTKLVERVHVARPATREGSPNRHTPQGSFKCPVLGCGATFTREFNLRGHVRSHNEERPFKCKWPACDEAFAQRHDCKRHETQHLDIRPHTCEGCQKTFARMSALNRHLRSEGGAECRRAHSEITGQGMLDKVGYEGCLEI